MKRDLGQVKLHLTRMKRDLGQVKLHLTRMKRDLGQVKLHLTRMKRESERFKRRIRPCKQQTVPLLAGTVFSRRERLYHNLGYFIDSSIPDTGIFARGY